ncbi:serine O-acetyltransferase [Pedobacter africanus]|nr:DapH/DapD/GlmU-related protein [Pedobacter africanus]
MKLLLLLGQKSLKIPMVGNFFSVGFEYLIRIFFASDISCKATIPRNVTFVHGHDIVIGSEVIIGNNCKIFNGVTLGNKDTESGLNSHPTIGDNCVISTGAKVMGNIRVGNNCIIGANSVLFIDVPDNSIAVGVPARILRKD